MESDYICMNKFSHIESSKVKILFCHYDRFIENVQHVRNNSNEKFVFICGNSDYSLGTNYNPPGGSEFLENVPTNLLKIYSQNCLVPDNNKNFDKFDIIPIGIGNYVFCKGGEAYGKIWPECKERFFILSDKEFIKKVYNKTPTKFIYSNFTINDNLYRSNHRSLVSKICKKSSYIDWEEPKLTSYEYYNKILDYEAVVCAEGNGPGDNHRIYETLYLNRIPIVFNSAMYEKLHHKFPVILLKNLELLNDYDFIREKIEEIKNKYFGKIRDVEELKYSFWEKRIINFLNDL